MEEYKGEYINEIALILKNGTVWSLPSKDENGNQNRHHHVIAHMRKNDITVGDVLDADQGFITNTGRYVNRVEALEIAKKANQIKHHIPGGEHELYSEHLGTNHKF